MMSSQEIRQKFLDFFKSKNHVIIPSAPLIPENDPTALFTTAGMHPLVPFLLGQPHPSGRRLANIQKCLRTNDIDEVGDSTHLTFFEMLGNWSLGDYFKSESITWSYEFLTKEMNIPHDRLTVTVFAGDQDAPRDTESADIWQNIGIPVNKIFYYSKKDNWWGPAGQTGPCGPDTEIFYDSHPDQDPTGPDADDQRYVEIWNNVFMQYNKTPQATFDPMSQKNVDTGLGFERLVMFMQKQTSVFATDLFQEMYQILQRHLDLDKTNIQSERIILDHSRTAIMLLSEKLVPSNLEQGYVLRKVIRRAIRHMRKIGITDYNSLFQELANSLINSQDHPYPYSQYYPELITNQDFIRSELTKEVDRFTHVLEKGLKEFEKNLEQINKYHQPGQSRILSGRTAFKLYDTYGFPIEITQELTKENNLEIDLEGYQEAFNKHQELSRQSTEGKFKGGLADHSEITTAYHTTTHLLHAALRQILGNHVEQRGSNITAERLRFDFSHPDKMTPEQIQQVADWVNQTITNDLIVEKQEMTLEDALASGAIGLFTSKYGEQVSVYTIKNKNTGEIYSREICGGPHVTSGQELGHFKIIKEESSSAGIRRIKAVLEK